MSDKIKDALKSINNGNENGDEYEEIIDMPDEGAEGSKPNPKSGKKGNASKSAPSSGAKGHSSSSMPSSSTPKKSQPNSTPSSSSPSIAPNTSVENGNQNNSAGGNAPSLNSNNTVGQSGEGNHDDGLNQPGNAQDEFGAPQSERGNAQKEQGNAQKKESKDSKEQKDSSREPKDSKDKNQNLNTQNNSQNLQKNNNLNSNSQHSKINDKNNKNKDIDVKDKKKKKDERKQRRTQKKEKRKARRKKRKEKFEKFKSILGGIKRWINKIKRWIVIGIISIIFLMLFFIIFSTTILNVLKSILDWLDFDFGQEFSLFWSGDVSIDDERAEDFIQELENMGIEPESMGFVDATRPFEYDNYEYIKKILATDLLTYYSKGTSIFGRDYGVIDIKAADINGMFDLTECKVDIENKTLTLITKTSGWSDWGSALGLSNGRVTSVFNLDGWTGRYGMPKEFLIALHLATMAPDFVESVMDYVQPNIVVEMELYERPFERLVYDYLPDGTWDETAEVLNTGYEKKGDNIKMLTPYITRAVTWYKIIDFDGCYVFTDDKQIDRYLYDPDEDEKINLTENIAGDGTEPIKSNEKATFAGTAEMGYTINGESIKDIVEKHYRENSTEAEGGFWENFDKIGHNAWESGLYPANKYYEGVVDFDTAYPVCRKSGDYYYADCLTSNCDIIEGTAHTRDEIVKEAYDDGYIFRCKKCGGKIDDPTGKYILKETITGTITQIKEPEVSLIPYEETSEEVGMYLGLDQMDETILKNIKLHYEESYYRQMHDPDFVTYGTDQHYYWSDDVIYDPETDSVAEGNTVVSGYIDFLYYTIVMKGTQADIEDVKEGLQANGGSLLTYMNDTGKFVKSFLPDEQERVCGKHLYMDSRMLGDLVDSEMYMLPQCYKHDDGLYYNLCPQMMIHGSFEYEFDDVKIEGTQHSESIPMWDAKCEKWRCKLCGGEVTDEEVVKSAENKKNNEDNEETNVTDGLETFKSLFKNGKYRIYDGTNVDYEDRPLRSLIETYVDENGVEQTVANVPRTINMAFSILENTNSTDAQVILRDLKEFMTEEGYYFSTSIFDNFSSKASFIWIMPNNYPSDWPTSADINGSDNIISSSNFKTEDGSIKKEEELTVVSPANAKIISIEDDTIALRFTSGVNKDMTMIISGIDVDDSLGVIDESDFKNYSNNINELIKNDMESLAANTGGSNGTKTTVTSAEKIGTAIPDKDIVIRLLNQNGTRVLASDYMRALDPNYEYVMAADGNAYPILKQSDKRWGQMRYSHGNGCNCATISSHGCGPSSMAMLISGLTGKVITPYEYSELLGNSYKTCDGSTYGVADNNIVKSYGITVHRNTYNEGSSFGNNSVAYMKAILNETNLKRAVFAHSTGHFIAFVPAGNNKVYILDPAGFYMPIDENGKLVVYGADDINSAATSIAKAYEDKTFNKRTGLSKILCNDFVSLSMQ